MSRTMTHGIHHAELAIADLDACERVRDRPGGVAEFTPGPVRAGSPVHRFICAVPGGMRLELATAAA